MGLLEFRKLGRFLRGVSGGGQRIGFMDFKLEWD